MRRSWKLLGLLLLLPLLAQAQTLEEAARNAAGLLTENLEVDPPLEVEMTSLTLEGTQASTPFSEAFLEALQQELRQNREDFQKVERRDIQPEALTRGISVAKPNYSSTNPTVQDVVLEGSYREAGERLFVTIRLLTEAGPTVSRAEVPIALDQLSLEHRPPQEEALREESEDLAELLELPQEVPLTVQLAKGDGATYFSGDPFEVLLFPETEVYVRLIYRDVNGTTTPIYSSDFALAPGRPHQLPPRINGRPQWQISCDAGCGPETLVVVASSTPIPEEVTTRSFSAGSWRLAESLQQLYREVKTPGPLQSAAQRGSSNTERRGVQESQYSMLVLHLTTMER